MVEVPSPSRRSQAAIAEARAQAHPPGWAPAVPEPRRRRRFRLALAAVWIATAAIRLVLADDTTSAVIAVVGILAGVFVLVEGVRIKPAAA
jgi:hypothetical protein